MQTLRSNSQATVAELRQFLSELKGRSPQDVMGVVAQSSLFQGIMTASVCCAVLLIVFTAGPWLLSGSPKKQTAVAARPTIAAEQPAVAAPPDETPTAANTQTAPSSDLQKAASAMGIGETKEADPDTNPLDSKLDNLLDGIE